MGEYIEWHGIFNSMAYVLDKEWIVSEKKTILR